MADQWMNFMMLPFNCGKAITEAPMPQLSVHHVPPDISLHSVYDAYVADRATRAYRFMSQQAPTSRVECLNNNSSFSEWLRMS